MQLQAHGARIAHMSGGYLPDAPDGREVTFELELHFHESQGDEHAALFVTTEFLEDHQHVLIGGLVYVGSDEDLTSCSDDELALAVESSGLHHVAYDHCALVARQVRGTLGFDLSIDDFTPTPDITIDRMPSVAPSDLESKDSNLDESGG